jgi:hypothetical protein
MTCGGCCAYGLEALAGVAIFSRSVGVDGAGRAGAELDDEFLPAKVLEYVLK